MLDRWNERLKSHPLVVAGFLTLVAFAVYGTVLAYGFVYDDVEQILRNPFVLNPRLWAKNLTTSVWTFQGIQTNFYRPLQFFLYWLLYRIAGPSPGLFHLFNLFLYVATAWLVYRLGRGLLGSELPALAGALLWVLHPLHVEAVAWVSALPDVGCGFFYLLAFLLFLRAEDSTRSRFRQHTFAALAFFCALLFKETAISFLLLPLAYWFLYGAPGSWRDRALRWLPYGAAFGAYLVIRKSVLGFLTAKPFPSEGLLRLASASLGLLGEHIRLFFWPVRLTAFRTFEPVRSLHSPWPWLALLGLIALLLLRQRDRVLSFLLAWWGVTLLPCLDFRMLSSPLIADRFSYVPSVGLCLATSYLILERIPARIPSPRVTRLAVAGLILLMCLWTIRTRRTIPQWSGDETLVNNGLQMSPDSALLHLAQAVIKQYRYNDLEGATREYETAIELNRRSLKPLNGVVSESFLGLGQISQARGRTEEAVSYYEKAIKASRVNNSAYDALGAVYFPRRDYAKAAEYFAAALKSNPYDLGARFYLGTCWMELGKYREAAEQFRAAREIDPVYWQAYEAEARALEAAGEAAGAAHVRSMKPPH